MFHRRNGSGDVSGGYKPDETPPPVVSSAATTVPRNPLKALFQHSSTSSAPASAANQTSPTGALDRIKKRASVAFPTKTSSSSAYGSEATRTSRDEARSSALSVIVILVPQGLPFLRTKLLLEYI